MDNYEFCARYAVDSRAHKVLDFGCGDGRLVKLLGSAGLDAFGCDPFYEGGNFDQIPEPIRRKIAKMDDGKIPFPDGSFDLVVSNQVMEHVSDLDLAVSEIARVLRPGGKCLSLFPHLETWREGHCNVPFLHWFPKESPLRIRYAKAFYAIGYFTEDKERGEWAEHICSWIDRWCYYRTRKTIAETFSKHLSSPVHIESDWMLKRSSATRFAPAWLRRVAADKFAGLVFLTYKPTTVSNTR